MMEVDLRTWKRREHFEFFSRMDLPFYNVNVHVDITGLRDFAHANSLSFNTLLIHLTTHCLSRIENFRYRVRGNRIVLHDRLNPCFAHIRKGDDLFSLISVDLVEDRSEFDRLVRAAIENADRYFDLEKLAGRDDLVFISSMPWISFTGTDHTLNLQKDDAIPRITWGKYFEQNGKTLLPYNIQVNHRFVDGLHVGRFFEELDREIARLRGAISG